MLKVYVYCSYRSSPEGFTLGAFNTDNLKNDEEYIYINKKDASNKTVAKLFYSGTAKSAYGKLPECIDETGNYIYIIKDLKCDFVNEDNMPSIKYGNFAFETDDPELYRRIFFNLKRLGFKELNKYLDLLLIPDVSIPAFRSKISYVGFENFYKELTREVEGKIKDDFLIVTPSKEADYSEDLEKIVGYPIVRYNENKYCVKKKLNFLLIIFLILLLVFFMLFLIIFPIL